MAGACRTVSGARTVQHRERYSSKRPRMLPWNDATLTITNVAICLSDVLGSIKRPHWPMIPVRLLTHR